MTNTKQLEAQLQALAEQVSRLEQRIVELEAEQEIPEEDLVVIGAAVAGYFGHKAKIRAIRYGGQSRWGAATRGRVHDRRVSHAR